MPLYAYRCQKCGAEEEHIQKVDEPPPGPCATCGGPMEKLMTSAAFHLKGGGWYADGYSSSKPGETAEPKDSKPKDSGSSSGADAGSGSAGDGGAGKADGGGGKADAGGKSKAAKGSTKAANE